MSADDLEHIWKQINDELDQDEDLELEPYLKQKGIEKNRVSSSLNNHVNHLFDSSFGIDQAFHDQINSKYRIIEKIDSGGQSEVYLAKRSDGAYQQTVVVKLFSNRFNQDSMKQLFLHEMQLLADLKHPGIVTIIDGSIHKEKDPSSLPWLILEYIDGPHLDEYCFSSCLETETILQLIVNICDTLDFIHRRGVFHKDIKPQNILVKTINQVPYPVLIDFGIAQESKQKSSEFVFATHGYSSPEQIHNKNIDQRSDIYSLGVVLIKLLMTKSFSIQAFINDRNQYIQSNIASKDLRLILLHCIHENPNLRYQTASELRNDINNYLLGNPLSFNSNNLADVFVKSFKRNKVLYLSFFAVIFTSVFFAFKYTSNIRHLQQQTLVQKNASDELMNFMLKDMYEGLVRIGKVDLLQTVVDKSLSHLKSVSPSSFDTQSLFQAAIAYMNAGRVLDQLERTDQADQSFITANNLLDAVKQEPPYLQQYLRLKAQLHVYHAKVLSSEGQEQRTEQVLLQSINSSNKLFQLNPSEEPTLYWEAHLEMGYHYLEYGKQQQAKTYIDKAISISKSWTEHSNNSAEWLYHYSHSYQLLAWYEFDFGDLSIGISALDFAIENAKKAVSIDQKDLRKLNNIRILHNQLSYFHLENGDYSLAQIAIEEALKRGQELKSNAPLNQEFNRELSYSFSTATEIYQKQNQWELASDSIEQSLIISKNNYQMDPSDFSTANDLAIDLILAGKIYLNKNQQDIFYSYIQQAHKIIQEVHEKEPNNLYYTHTMLITLLLLDQLEAAKPIYQELLNADLIDNQIKEILKDKSLESWQSTK
jgi:serine/threonine protein kinase/Tfp pilus assembly protein PilF